MMEVLYFSVSVRCTWIQTLEPKKRKSSHIVELKCFHPWKGYKVESRCHQHGYGNIMEKWRAKVI